MTTDIPLRTLVVDDSALYRKIIRELLAEISEVEVVGVATNGQVALDMLNEFKPELMTLDVEMPQLDGLGVLRELRRQKSEIGTIILSGVGNTAASNTTKALELGAFDFIVKPAEKDPKTSVMKLRTELLPKIRAYAKNVWDIRARGKLPKSASLQNANTNTTASKSALRIKAGPPQVVAIGVSTGGPAALAMVLPKLPPKLSVPILIVQHMPAGFTKSLADDLARNCPLPVTEALDGEALLPRHIYIAPGGRQMKIERVDKKVVIRITDDPPEKSCRPSVDYLFRSVAEVYGAQTLGIILTGMGDDGTSGCRVLKQQGATVLTQDSASCVVYGMPRSVVEAGLSDAIYPLDGIASEIYQRVEVGGKPCR